jgi:hypothetical protein
MVSPETRGKQNVLPGESRREVMSGSEGKGTKRAMLVEADHSGRARMAAQIWAEAAVRTVGERLARMARAAARRAGLLGGGMGRVEPQIDGLTRMGKCEDAGRGTFTSAGSKCRVVA